MTPLNLQRLMSLSQKDAPENEVAIKDGGKTGEQKNPGEQLPEIPVPPGNNISVASNTLSTQAYEVLKKHCYQCHGIKFEVDGLNILNRNSMAEDEYYLVPGSAAESEIWNRMGVAKNMPPKKTASRPNETELNIVKQWIEAGAPDFPRDEQRKPVSQEQMLLAMRADLLNAPIENRKFYRYYTLSNLHNNSFATRLGKDTKNIDQSELELTAAAFSKLVNSLSWEPDIVVPKPVNEEKTVYRIDLRDLGWVDDNLWAKMVAAYPYGVNYERHPKPSLRNVAIEVNRMTESELPYLRVDWFLDTVSRPPLYYTILRLPENVKKLEDVLNVDVESDFKLNRIKRAGFATSGVSQHNRLVDRHPALYGAYWKSYDFGQSEGRGNLFKFPLGPTFATNNFSEHAFKHDGGEMIFNLPNGLQGYYLSEADGKRLSVRADQCCT